jgi:hypothetical protein
MQLQFQVAVATPIPSLQLDYVRKPEHTEIMNMLFEQILVNELLVQEKQALLEMLEQDTIEKRRTYKLKKAFKERDRITKDKKIKKLKKKVDKLQKEILVKKIVNVREVPTPSKDLKQVPLSNYEKISNRLGFKP